MIENHRILILALLTLLLPTSCDWVKSDLTGCPEGQWLALDCSYNLLDADVSSEMEDVTVMVYDSTGKYVRSILSTKSERTENEGKIGLDILENGTYTFIVWSGIEHSDAMTSYHSDGKNCLDSLRVGLKNPDKIQNQDFGDIYYGAIYKLKVDGKPKVDTVKMMKDSNKLVCLVRYADADTLKAETYTMTVKAPNGTMDASNKPLKDQVVTYQPYSEETVKMSDDDSTVVAARYGFQLLRLLKDDNSRLVLKKKDSNETLMDIPLTDYIGQVGVLYQMYGRSLTEQEYLDRQDFHTFVIYLSKKDDTLLKLKVNECTIRMNDVCLK